MTSLVGDILNRVKRLPKPTSATEALQPIFEAVSNAIHAVDDRFQSLAAQNGQITVEVDNIGDPDQLAVSVSDNGVGLDADRFLAFKTTDTDFKMERGGKGVGRLLWLDGFENISVESTFINNEGNKNTRRFKFQLTSDDQITEETVVTSEISQDLGTRINFKGLRGKAYSEKFPTYPATLRKHFGSHFLADFILSQCPKTDLRIGDDLISFPEGITAMLKETRKTIEFRVPEYGEFTLSNFIFNKAASSDLEGDHQLHLVASRRTVLTRKIDGLLGIGRLGEDRSAVFHGCLEGQFLDERVNQERTAFNFAEEIVENLIRAAADTVRTEVLGDEIKEFDSSRLNSLVDFLDFYPSFRLDEPTQLLRKTPRNATKPDEFARALITDRVRRDYERRDQVKEILELIGGEGGVPEDYHERIKEVADSIKAAEQRQLTEYIVRRKLALDMMDVLLKKLKVNARGKPNHQLEETLHKFICPMRVRGDDPKKVESSEHDLWIVDERLTFARYFASDVPFSKILDESNSKDEPDLFVFERIHGLGIEGEDPLTQAMLVEFKRPMKTAFEAKYLPGNQVIRYLSEIQGKTIDGFDGSTVRIADDCVFYCYIVADIEGDMKVHTSNWNKTANGRGRWQPLQGDYRGMIEVIEWKDLLNDARLRNAAFLNEVGLHGSKA